MTDIQKMIAWIHDLEIADPDTIINAVVVSPEMHEILLRMARFDSEEMKGFFGGVKIYVHKYLGEVVVYGNREKLIEAGFIKGEG